MESKFNTQDLKGTKRKGKCLKQRKSSRKKFTAFDKLANKSLESAKIYENCIQKSFTFKDTQTETDPILSKINNEKFYPKTIKKIRIVIRTRKFIEKPSNRKGQNLSPKLYIPGINKIDSKILRHKSLDEIRKLPQCRLHGLKF